MTFATRRRFGYVNVVHLAYFVRKITFTYFALPGNPYDMNVSDAV